MPTYYNPNIKSITPTAPFRMLTTPSSKFSTPTLKQPKPAKTDIIFPLSNDSHYVSASNFLKRIENEKVLCLALAIAYFDLIMFFKEECEICYEKSKKALKKKVDYDEQKINEILRKVKEW
ncbi:17842_t:CDS:2, partial [Racocetra persica]